VVHWAEGGETSLSNLLLVCTHHHRLLHEGGFALAPAGNGRLRYLRPDGRPVEVHRFTGAGAKVREVTETEMTQVRDAAPRYQLGSISPPGQRADFPRKVDRVHKCETSLVTG
jgi:hypothetical protein